MNVFKRSIGSVHLRPQRRTPPCGLNRTPEDPGWAGDESIERTFECLESNDLSRSFTQMVLLTSKWFAPSLEECAPLQFLSFSFDHLCRSFVLVWFRALLIFFPLFWQDCCLLLGENDLGVAPVLILVSLGLVLRVHFLLIECYAVPCDYLHFLSKNFAFCVGIFACSQMVHFSSRSFLVEVVLKLCSRLCVRHWSSLLLLCALFL
jgi:hypothetical protein